MMRAAGITIASLVLAAASTAQVSSRAQPLPSTTRTEQRATSTFSVTEDQLTSTATQEFAADICGVTAVYTADGIGSQDLFAIDVVTGAGFVVTVASGSQYDSDIDGDIIAYVDATSGFNNISYYDQSSGLIHAATGLTSNDNDPAVSGSNIVFVSDRSGSDEIMYFDMVTSAENFITLTGLLLTGAPDIDGTLVAWHQWNGTSMDVAATYLGGTSFIAAGASGHEENPNVCGTRIGYTVDGDVAYYDVATDETVMVTNDAFQQQQVHLNDTTILWTDDRNGNFDIFLHDLCDGQTYQLTTDPSDQNLTGVSGNRAVFDDSRAGNLNVFALEWQLEHLPTADASLSPSGDVLIGTTIQLDSSASTGTCEGEAIDAWAWAIVSAPPESTATLSDPTIPNPTFVPDWPGSYTFALVVSANGKESEPALTGVTATVWEDLGNGLVGCCAFAPALSGSGDLVAGESMSLGLFAINYPQFTPTHLVVGLSALYAPFKGGVMVPDPGAPGLVVPMATDVTGVAIIGATWSPGIPSGFTLYFQHWIPDAGGPAGFAASNAISGTTP